MGGALRVLQSGEYRLDQPLLGGSHLPDALKNQVCEARYRAVSQIIETAISQNADLLIIAGNAFDWSADRRPGWFLAEQFNRLDRAGVQVVWAELSQGAFPAMISLPSNVHQVTPLTRSLIHTSGLTIEFCWDWETAPTTNTQTRVHQSIDLSITFQRNTDTSPTGIREVVYQWHQQSAQRVPVTTIQGMASSQPGPQGVQFLTWDDVFENRFIATDSVRWVSESVEITTQTTRKSLQSELAQRQQRLLSHVDTKQPRLTLCHWRFTGTGQLWDELIHTDLSEFAFSELETHHSLHHFWSTSVDLVPENQQLLNWRQQEAMSVGFDELALHFAGSGNLIPDSFQKPQWATNMKTAALKKSVIPQLVNSLQRATSF